MRAHLIELIASAQFTAALTQVILATTIGAFALRSTIGWAGYIAVVAGLVCLGILSLIARREQLDWHGLLPVTVLAFLAWSALSVVWSGYQWATLSSALYQSAIAFLAIVIALSRDTFQIVRALGGVLRVVLAASLALEVFSGLIIDLPITFLRVQGLLASGGPIQGLSGTRNQLGLLAVIAAATFAVELLTRSVRRGVAIGSLVLAGTVLLFTRSVVSIGVLVLVALVAIVLRGIRRAPPERRPALQVMALVSTAVIGGAAWLARVRLIDVLNAGSEFEYRIALWRQVWRISAESPILGQGFIGYWRTDLYPYSFIDTITGRPHQSALNALYDVDLQLGLVGAALFLALVGLAFVRSWLLASDRKAVVYVWPVLILISLVATSFAESSILVDTGFLLLVVCALKASQGLSWRRMLSPAER